MGFPGSSAGKESACNVGDLGSIPGLEDPLQKGTASHSSSLDCIVHGVAKSWTWLSDFHFHTHTHIHTHICITEARCCVHETLLKNYTSIKKKRNLRCLVSSSCSSSTQVIIDISSRIPRGKKSIPSENTLIEKANNINNHKSTRK